MDGISIDPVKRELIKNALRTICDNMIVLVIRTSRSVVVKNNLDFSSSILDSNGEMVVQGLSLPAHLGATMPALKGCMDYFGDDIHEGADSSEGGHLFQSDRGHHSNLMAASLLSSRGPVSVMSWRRSRGQVVASELGHIRPRFLLDKADWHPSFHWRC